MSGLPERPDLDQLRRQARELLRAATRGEPPALARLRAVSGHVTLSAAQLAVAREHGYRSWPELRAEVQRRRGLPDLTAGPPSQGGDGGGRRGVAPDRWSFGGVTAIETPAGPLFPDVLLAGAGHAVLYATLEPASEFAAARPRRVHPLRRAQAAPAMLLALRSRRGRDSLARRRHAMESVSRIRAVANWLDAVTVTDDRGARYALRSEGISGRVGPRGENVGPRTVRLSVDPVPGRGTGWIELRGRDGEAERLLPSARTTVRVGQRVPAAASPAERELSDLALHLISLQIGAGMRADLLRRRCSAALDRAAELQRGGGLDPASELVGQLTLLCAVLTGDRPAGGLASGWKRMLDAGGRADGSRHHFDIGAALPPVDGVSVRLDSLVCLPGGWRLYLRAVPGWRNYAEDGRPGARPLSVYAEDDLGGSYLSIFGGSTGPKPHSDEDEDDSDGPGGGAQPGPPSYEEFSLQFLPRLDPLADALKLTFRGNTQQLSVEIRLEPATASQPA